MQKLITREIHTALFFLWIILALPWLIFAPRLGMVFDSGEPHSLKVYTLLVAVWSYPLAVTLAAVLRHKMPMIAFLPFLNVGSALILWKLN